MSKYKFTTRTRDLYDRYKTFHGTTGGVVGQAANYAWKLAQAQRMLDKAVDSNYARVDWDYDQFPDISWMDKRDRKLYDDGFLEIFRVEVEVGQKTESLYGISVLTGTAERDREAEAYKRQIEAELALELMNELRRVTRMR